MSEMLSFLGSLSFGEFIIIWVSTILLVLFYLFLLYSFVQIKKDSNLLKINIISMVDLLKDEYKLAILRDDKIR
jgi:hypothetical protein